MSDTPPRSGYADASRAGDGRLVGSIYTGRPGRSPFDPTLWSSISSRLFTRLRQRGELHRVIGVELPWPGKAFHLARTVSPNRAVWKSRFQADAGYREALTRHLARCLSPDELRRPGFQVGAMFDAPLILDGRAECFSYHDGNLAERISSPLPFPPLRSGVIDRALAFERRVYHGMTRVFTFSRYLARSFVKNYDLPPDRVTTVGAGINLEQMPVPDPDKRYDTQHLLFIGVEFERKGGTHLLRAFARVREKFPRATLHVVGPPRPAAGPADGVVWHGFLSKQNPEQAAELDALFRQASLFVLPSLYEPFGIAPLEAMAHQVPCVLTDGWALAEMVTPGVTGELVPPADPDALSETVIRLLSDPDVLGRLGPAARQSVLDHHQWDKVVDRLLSGMNRPPNPNPNPTEPAP